MKTNLITAAIGLCSLFGLQTPARGSITAAATIAPRQLAPGSFQYSFTLTNTGTTSISTFWFGWIPAYDLLPHASTSFTSPAGWTGTDAPDDFGVASAQWVTSTNALQPGQSIGGFSFDTIDPPSTIGGTSSFFGLPVEQSYVYIGAPETDPGFALVPSTVPEPSSLALLLGIPAMLLIRRRRPEMFCEEACNE